MSWAYMYLDYSGELHAYSNQLKVLVTYVSIYKVHSFPYIFCYIKEKALTLINMRLDLSVKGMDD